MVAAGKTSFLADDFIKVVSLSVDEACQQDNESAYYEPWNMLLTHVCLMHADDSCRFTTGPQPCFTREVFSNAAGPVDLEAEIGEII